eukprot:2540955-Pleurochrysis_carterae.AAC.1
MPDPRLKLHRSPLMLSRWRRQVHHPHRRVLDGRAPWMNTTRNGGRTCRLAWRPWRLAPCVARLNA